WFARLARSEEGEELALADVERDSLQRLHVAGEGLRQIADPDQGFRCHIVHPHAPERRGPASASRRAFLFSPAYKKSMGFRPAVERGGGPSNRGRRGRRAGEWFLMNRDDKVIGERVEGPKLIGFIGLGNLGATMASNVLTAGSPDVGGDST